MTSTVDGEDRQQKDATKPYWNSHAGDVIHALNSFAVRSVDGLRVLLDDVKADGELVLQIERGGQLLFVTCQVY